MTPYEKATEKLVQQVNKLKMPPEFKPMYDMEQVVRTFRVAFRNPVIRRKTLLNKYEDARIASERYSAGFCGIASYTWNHLFRMSDGSEVWHLKMISDGEYDIGNHVWLENAFTGEPLDLTFDQFVDQNGNFVKLPYSAIGRFVNSDFEFVRAYKFARFLGLNLGDIVFENALRSLGRGG